MEPKKFAKIAYSITGGCMAAAFVLKFAGMERAFMLMMFFSAVVLTVVSMITVILAVRYINRLQAEKPFKEKEESRSHLLQVADELKAVQDGNEPEQKA